jgi:hypothetical protein
MTIILGGDSLFHTKKTLKSIPRSGKGRLDVKLSRGYDTVYHEKYCYVNIV